ncbi:hypothetical protein MRX96_009113 [Rhipicephalus microplus]
MDQLPILLLDKRTGVPACLSLQPLRKCAPFDTRPARSTRAPVAAELCRCLVIALDVRWPRLHCTFSGTELLLRSQHRTSPRAQQPEVKDNRDGGGRTSNPHRDLGRTSLPRGPFRNGRRS